ncbi:MAG: STAS domain-containing protein [Planctomycetota bacterium]|nr:STAS domain-containing protein [Planctomycetota bacterium]
MPSELTIEVDQSRDGIVVITPVGEVDLASSPVLRTRLGEVVKSRPNRVVLDLSKVPYMDSSGVATLVEGLQQCRRQSSDLFLAALQDRVRSVFEIARLDTVFTIEPDVATACGE